MCSAYCKYSFSDIYTKKIYLGISCCYLLFVCGGIYMSRHKIYFFMLGFVIWKVCDENCTLKYPTYSALTYRVTSQAFVNFGCSRAGSVRSSRRSFHARQAGLTRPLYVLR